jgi:hypothetical protein
VVLSYPEECSILIAKAGHSSQLRNIGMSGNSLVNLGDLTKPATVLIEKISDAVGGIFKPGQIIRVAKAEAEADKIRAASEIEITDIHRRAMHRFLEEEARKQANIEAITQQALPHVDENATPEKVDDDWITNFFDKCRIVSDKDMQRLWARVLASEANAPGSFSRRTVNLIADLDKRDAILFVRLCSFCWEIGSELIPFIFAFPGDSGPAFTKDDGDFYGQCGMTFDNARHLEALGLVQISDTGSYSCCLVCESVTVSYYGRRLTVEFHSQPKCTLPVGRVLLTQAGQELAPHCGAEPIEEFFEYVRDWWPRIASFSNSLLKTVSEQSEPKEVA